MGHPDFLLNLFLPASLGNSGCRVLQRIPIRSRFRAVHGDSISTVASSPVA